MDTIYIVFEFKKGFDFVPFVEYCKTKVLVEMRFLHICDKYQNLVYYM